MISMMESMKRNSPFILPMVAPIEVKAKIRVDLVSTLSMRMTPVPQGTNTQEKNSIVVRGAHTFKNVLGQENFSTQLGASAWYSTIENKRSGEDGDRQVYSVFSNTNYNQWNLQLLAGYQDIDNADTEYKDHLTLGGFDYSFNSATKGQIYSAELSYLFSQQFGPITSIRPYLNYSSYQKEQDGFKDSTRFIPGIAFNYQKLTVQAELLMGKHDPYLGDSEGLAAGGTNDKWNKKSVCNFCLLLLTPKTKANRCWPLFLSRYLFLL